MCDFASILFNYALQCDMLFNKNFLDLHLLQLSINVCVGVCSLNVGSHVVAPNSSWFYSPKAHRDDEDEWIVSSGAPLKIVSDNTNHLETFDGL